MRAAQNLLSNLTDFMAEPLLFMNELAGEAEMKAVRIGPKRFVFIFSPESAQEILLKRPQVYVQNRTVFDRIQPVTGKKGLVQLSGQESKEARAKSRTMFSGFSLENARRITEELTDSMITKLGNAETMMVIEEMTALILRTALKILIGVESDELVERIGDKFLRLNYLCGLRMRSLIPAPLFLPTYKNREIKKLQLEIRSLIAAQINTEQLSGVPHAFAGDENLIDHCMTFLFAGHETTAASLAFTLLLLAQNPAYQEAIAAGDEAITTAVYKESLRLYPPAYMLAREADSDDQLEGISIRKGDQVIIGISELQRNPRLFERPDDFYPERFLDGRKLTHQFAFIPFGAGGKSCVGERLAYLEASVVLKKICQKYQISSAADPILAEPLITLHPVTGQTIQLKPRVRSSHD
ncbi:MAG: cytochrome P450 [Bdellovibrionota bacterium]